MANEIQKNPNRLHIQLAVASPVLDLLHARGMNAAVAVRTLGLGIQWLASKWFLGISALVITVGCTTDTLTDPMGYFTHSWHLLNRNVPAAKAEA